ncbi:hypothetical protein TI05_12985 [Achromatium sp. WMS3]|nr:hypothetical protein TI05_12985 [Achromatium sp. WMS3]
MVKIPTSDLGFIQQKLHDITQELQETYDDTIDNNIDNNIDNDIDNNISNTIEDIDDTLIATNASNTRHPNILVKALEQLLHQLQFIQRKDHEILKNNQTNVLETQDHNTLANYGIKLFADLTHIAKTLQISNIHDELRRLGFGFGLWVAQNDIEITLLAPLVDNIAFVFSELSQPSDFVQLYTATSQIMEATSFTQQENNKRNPACWERLVLNRTKIAIQTHQQPLIEQAFEAIIELLPEQAADFFQECTTRMEMAQYPTTTKTIIEKYCLLYCKPHTLH